MGLAASQARFLGITARKSNIEYEGQQVNQQRTALAEEVNALYSSLIALEAPLPPDTTQFYNSNYSFEIKATANENQGTYRLLEYGPNKNDSYYAYVERTHTEVVAVENDLDKDGYKLGVNEDGTYYIEKDGTKTPLAAVEDEEQNKDLRDLINSTADISPITENETFFSYDLNGERCYIPSSLVTAQPTPEQIYSFKKGKDTFKTRETIDPVDIKFDDNGRPSKITIDDFSYDVNASRYHDDERYEAALRDYTMEKDEYNKMVADLNARTESLQQEDKVLELRLNQIDTEQQQLSTELEAVKNVLKENIESTFKTFS